MLDTVGAQLALRGRLLSLVVCTTGATSLSATTTGYARATGSFLSDGFSVGMEITPTGFATNTVDIITVVSDLSITTASARTAESSAGGRAIAAKLPVSRAFENNDFAPTVGRPYIEEDFVPATSRLVTFPAQGGQLDESGLYVIKWYGLSGKGISAIRKSTDALKALFTAGTVLNVGSAKVRISATAGAYASQILPQGDGFSVCTVTVPWSARSVNAVAA